MWFLNGGDWCKDRPLKPYLPYRCTHTNNMGGGVFLLLRFPLMYYQIQMSHVVFVYSYKTKLLGLAINSKDHIYLSHLVASNINLSMCHYLTNRLIKIKYTVLGTLYQRKNQIWNLDVLCKYSKYQSIITRPFRELFPKLVGHAIHARDRQNEEKHNGR